MVRRGLVDDDQLTGKCCLIVRIDNTVLLAEKARIQVKTPYLSGEVESLCMSEAICDLVGNVQGVRTPDDPDMTAMVGAVTTRAQAHRSGSGRSDSSKMIKPSRGWARLMCLKIAREEHHL